MVNHNFVVPVNLPIEVSKQYQLTIKDPAADGSYQEIRWYKNTHSNSIAYYNKGVNDGKPQYFNEYCSGPGYSCSESDKGELSISDGILTIYQVELSDSDYYYYRFYAPTSVMDTGSSYQYNIFVYGKFTSYSACCFHSLI